MNINTLEKIKVQAEGAATKVPNPELNLLTEVLDIVIEEAKEEEKKKKEAAKKKVITNIIAIVILIGIKVIAAL